MVYISIIILNNILIGVARKDTLYIYIYILVYIHIHHLSHAWKSENWACVPSLNRNSRSKGVRYRIRGEINEEIATFINCNYVAGICATCPALWAVHEEKQRFYSEFSSSVSFFWLLPAITTVSWPADLVRIVCGYSRGGRWSVAKNKATVQYNFI